MKDPELTEAVIGAAIQVHRLVGPGLLESAYKACFAHELGGRQIRFETEVPIPVVYDGLRLDCAFRADFIIESRLIVELKAVERIDAVHIAQVISYLRLTSCDLGLLIDFHVTMLKDGIRRLHRPALR